MKKIILLVLLASSILTAVVFARKETVSFEKRWARVEALADKQLPESALKEVNDILKQAKADKNEEQVIKAMVYKMRFALQREPDKAPELITEFETFTQKKTDPAERALLFSMTAEMYAQYYQRNQWTIIQRTEISGQTPENMKEWTKNIFFDKIEKLLQLSLYKPTVLQKANALKFAVLMQEGKDSRIFQPTLFDFLCYRSIDILQRLTNTSPTEDIFKNSVCFADISEFCKLQPDSSSRTSTQLQIVAAYQRLLAFRSKANNTPALLYADLQRLKSVKSICRMEDADSLYLNALNRLEKRYPTTESVVEVLAEKASYYLNSYSKDHNTYRRIADEICADGIRRFPNYKRITLLENIRKNIAQKTLSVNYNNVIRRNAPLKIRANSRNIRELELTVYRVNASAIKYTNFKTQRKEKELYPERTLVEKKSILVEPNENFEFVMSNVQLKPFDYGIYEFCVAPSKIEPGNDSVIGSFTVTDLTFIKRKTDPNTVSMYVLDRQTGNPVSDVKVDVGERKWGTDGYYLDIAPLYFSDSKGFFSHKTTQIYSNDVWFFSKGNDTYFATDLNVYFRQESSNKSQQLHLSLFTDRSLYRPGQTVYFKGIVTNIGKDFSEVLSGRNVEVVLFDANQQQIGSKSFKTNEFGSISGEFVLPEGGLSGDYSLGCKELGGELYFRVEEYKRPTFEVKIQRPKEEVRLGEKITVTGNVKAFAGYGIGNATVKYKVVRRVHRFCWWLRETQVEIANGTTKSNEDGNFEVPFVATKNQKVSNASEGGVYTYTVSVVVTDSKGETQYGGQALSIGTQSLFIITNVPEKINKSGNLAMNISTMTINDEVIHSNVQYALSRLEETDEYAENQTKDTDCKSLEQVFSGSVDTRDKVLNLNLSKLKSGRYKLVFSTKDSQGKEVKVEKIFVLYGSNDKKPPVKSYVWMPQTKTNLAVGEMAHINFGTSTRNTFVLFEIMRGNTILESRWVEMSDEIKTFDVPFKEEYGSGVTVMFTFMKDEKLFSRAVTLTRKVVDKKLTPKFSVFRNKLLPGEKAEWTVSIPECVLRNTPAELLVGMYDASLDAIYSSNWYFHPVFRDFVPSSPGWSTSHPYTSDRIYFKNDLKNVKDFSLNALNWYGLDLGNGFIGGNYTVRAMSGKMMVGEVKGKNNVNGKDIAEVKANVIQVAEEAGQVSDKQIFTMLEMVVENKKTQDEFAKASIQPRTNFNETAFFYPQLRTDPNGEVKFSFTAPESLTRWNVRMLAHTKDLYFGQFDTTAVTQKDLMVQMNLPRFVRRSDKLTLSANVVNLADKSLTASVQFEMIDPATEKVIYSSASSAIKSACEVTLAANETKAVEWNLTEFAPYDMVVCKVTACAGNFSDGEQKYLPVLPDKVLITESLPLTVRNGQTRTFSFDNLKKLASTVNTKNLSVEFSSNPAWYAVQALPTIAEPRSDDAFSLFTAFYANTLATHIANASPKLKAMFERWKKEGGSREALLSNLQKNQELKNILLEEAPWVTAAQNESEQKQQIALLFDQNNQNNKSQQYWEKLLKLQVSSGGFSWFPQMPADRYITQAILYRFACLDRLTGENLKTTYQLPVKSALHYLDLEIARDFMELKKHNPNYLKANCTGNMQLFYLLMRSEYPDYPVDESAREAVKYYTSQSKQYWTDCTLYGKAMMAVLAKRNGNMELAAAILQSLKENALKTDEMGMYWARNTSGYFWNERPIAVQAAILEAFRELQASTADLDELKIWLLRQKQTQSWDSPMATVDAIYALLNNGSDWLSNENKVQIKVGSMVLKPESAEAGTGYFKQSIPVADVKPSMGTVTVSSAKQEGGSIGWGAMYWQYFREQDQVNAQGTALRVTKSLFVKPANSKTDVMVPIAQAHLKKGDRIVTRLVVTTDRNLEYVALRDQRAACFEPVNQLSGYVWREGVGYYQTSKDTSTQFFFSFLPKGTYVFEYELWVNNAGTFTSGITTLQCLYAPEFVGHSGGEKLTIDN